MALVEEVLAETFLKSRHVRYELAPHDDVDSAMSEASAVGIPARWVIKTVLLRKDDGYALAILPASRMLDMHLVREAIGSQHVRLATEREIAERFPEFQLGALPPLPDLCGVTGYADPTVFDQDEAAFADGRRTESLIASPREVLWGQRVIVEPISRALEWTIEGDSIDLG